MASIRSRTYDLSGHEAVDLALVAGTAAVSVLSFFTLTRSLRTLLAGSSQEIYSDEDGEATKSSQAFCRALVPRLIVSGATVAGISITTHSLFSLQSGLAPHSDMGWVSVLNWVCQIYLAVDRWRHRLIKFRLSYRCKRLFLRLHLDSLSDTPMG